MRGDQLARQWQLVQRLEKSRAGCGLDDLADELGCVRRTVYRDLDALMYAGFPVVSEKRDGRVFYRFLDSFRLGDVPFTSDEILALAFGEDLLRRARNHGSISIRVPIFASTRRCHSAAAGFASRKLNKIVTA